MGLFLYNFPKCSLLIISKQKKFNIIFIDIIIYYYTDNKRK